METLLQDSDWDMVLEGLEALKSKDFSSEIMGDLFETLLLKPKKDAPQADILAWEKRQKEKEIAKKSEKKVKEQYKKKIDVLKAKIILMRESQESKLETSN